MLSEPWDRGDNCDLVYRSKAMDTSTLVVENAEKKERKSKKKEGKKKEEEKKDTRGGWGGGVCGGLKQLQFLAKLYDDRKLQTHYHVLDRVFKKRKRKRKKGKTYHSVD